MLKVTVTVTRILVMVTLRVLGCLFSLSRAHWRTHECSLCSPHMFSPRPPTSSHTDHPPGVRSLPRPPPYSLTLGKNPNSLLLAISHRPVLFLADFWASPRLSLSWFPCIGPVHPGSPFLSCQHQESLMVTLHFSAGCLPGRKRRCALSLLLLLSHYGKELSSKMPIDTFWCLKPLSNGFIWNLNI